MDYTLFPFNQLPVLELEDGTRLCQQDAVLRYLTATNGYHVGGTPKDQYAIDMLACAIDDLNVAYTGSVYSRNEPIGCELKPFVEGRCHKMLGALEFLAAQSTSEYWFGDKPAFPEWTLLHLIHAIQILKPTLLDEFPALAKWLAKMEARPRIKAYLESGKQRKMINGSSNGLEAVC